MEFRNRTPYPAILCRSAFGDERFVASLVCRVTFDLHGGVATPSAKQPWIVRPGPWTSEYGHVDGDEFLRRGGVDVLVFGTAVVPGGRPVPRQEVTIAVGEEFRQRLVLFGDRTWERSGDGLVASSPAPFVEMPLSVTRAFGGQARWDGLDVPFPLNPEGKGYYIDEPSAAGGSLPNIEDPAHLVQSWADHPEPVCTTICPIHNPLRALHGIELDDRKAITRIKPTYFNSAFPGMIAPQVAAGDWIVVDGVMESGRLEVQVPALQPVVTLTFGTTATEQPLAIDQVGLELNRARMFVSYRYPFRYWFVPKQHRSCELSLVGRG